MDGPKGILERFYQMNRNVHLLGELDQFGSNWQMEAASISDIIRLIDCQADGFRKFLIDSAESGLDLAIVGKDFLVTEPEELLFNNLGSEELYISLIPAGSRKGWGRILLGAVLIALSLAVPIPGAQEAGFKAAQTLSSTLLSVGLSIGLQGLTQLLAKTPDANDEKTKSGLFDGPESTLKQGQPVPILYGQLLIGGAPIHVNLTTASSNPSASGYSLLTRNNESQFNNNQVETDFGNIDIVPDIYYHDTFRFPTFPDREEPETGPYIIGN